MSKTPIFFKACSRIGLKNKPINQSELNLGVENGPDEILSPEFLNSLARPGLASVDEFNFLDPEQIPEEMFNQVLADSIVDFRDYIAESILSEAEGLQNDENATQIVVGGDHSVVLSSVLADISRFKPEEIGILHIDSHGDINLSKDSPTDNFHGMYLRPLFDHFDIPEIEALVPKKIPTENLVMIGNLDLDPGEKKFLEEKKVKLIPISNLGNLSSLSHLTEFKHLHVSFDIDVMDKTLAPGTGIPCDKGLTWEDLEPILKVIKSHPSFSFDLCEVNPKKDKEGRTVKLAQRILKFVL